MKRAYVVCGAESSGNRMVTAILGEAGCHGDASIRATLNDSLPEGESPVVLTRSFPHAGSDPDLFELRGRLKERGYAPYFVVVIRDMEACAQSQVRNGHQRSVILARICIQNAVGLLFSQLHISGIPFYVTTYEALTNHPCAVDAMLEALGLPPIGPHVTVEGQRGPLEDRNAQHYDQTVSA